MTTLCESIGEYYPPWIKKIILEEVGNGGKSVRNQFAPKNFCETNRAKLRWRRVQHPLLLLLLRSREGSGRSSNTPQILLASNGGEGFLLAPKTTGFPTSCAMMRERQAASFSPIMVSPPHIKAQKGLPEEVCAYVRCVCARVCVRARVCVWARDGFDSRDWKRRVTHGLLRSFPIHFAFLLSPLFCSSIENGRDEDGQLPPLMDGGHLRRGHFQDKTPEESGFDSLVCVGRKGGILR